MADASRYLTVKQVAERLNVKVPHVLALISSSTLRAIDISKPGAKRRTWRIPSDALAAFEAGRTNRPPDKPTPRRRKKQPAGFVEYF